MKAENAMDVERPRGFASHRGNLIFFLILLALIGGAILRSNIATQLDSFTIDEAYHIGAGVAYVQTGDFRLNPEHPPLVKLWVGAFVSGIYQLSPYRILADKADERQFVEEDVFLNNDPDAIQASARVAMFALNGGLLLLLALAARRTFGDIIALAAIAFLAIDPTVAAHLPVVMTDLPVALLSTTAVLFSVQAFRSWRPIDLMLAAVALGLTLSAKHSAVITVAAIVVVGITMAVFQLKGADTGSPRLRRVGLVGAVVIGAMIVLWSFYLFRFSESPVAVEEQFNRSLAEKISDVKSPRYRSGLNLMWSGHLFPRAYTWGMADTIRAGAEGRKFSAFAFGNTYPRTPFYFFPGVIGVKLPLGLLLLVVIGAALMMLRKIPREFNPPLLGVIVLAVLFLIVLSTGSSYGGIRHALPVVPPLALIASIAVYKAFEYKSRLLRGTVVIALVAALLSAIPVMRPWEYYNEIVGTANAYKYFGDEGIDAELRVKDLVKYYNENLRPTGELPFLLYPVHKAEKEARELDWIGEDPERDADRTNSETISGTIFIGARRARNAAFREATPIARFGNLFVFRGTFKFPEARNQSLTQRARNKIYTAQPDIEGAIKLLSQAVAINPKKFSNALELGNQYLRLGKREEALQAYRTSKDNAPPEDEISNILARQIERLETEPLEQIPPLRNPEVE